MESAAASGASGAAARSNAAVQVTAAKKLGGRRQWLRTIFILENFWAYFYLTVWFVLNIIITLYCKAIFSVYHFPCPLLTTAVHMVCTSLGVFCCQWLGVFVPAPATSQLWRTMSWFSVVFTLNIWLSNASLFAVSVNLHQVVRTTIPLFTMVVSALLFHERYSKTLLPPVLLVIVGVSLTVWGDMDVSVFGMFVVLLGCFFSSLKGIVTQKTQVGALGLSSLDVLRWLCPMSVVQLLVLALAVGEVNRLHEMWPTLQPAVGLHLAVLGSVAFGLNFVSFRCAALLNPLTLNIAGNAKQVITCLLSLALFGGELSVFLGAGIVGTAVGAYWYSRAMAAWRASTKAAAAAVQVASPHRALWSGGNTPADQADDGEDLELGRAPGADR